jgi:hypothetical protein
MEKNMIHKIPTPLAHVTSAITIKCRLLRLSKVKILPRAAEHAKKTTLEGAGVRQTPFQGKPLPSEEAKEL